VLCCVAVASGVVLDAEGAEALSGDSALAAALEEIARLRAENAALRVSLAEVLARDAERAAEMAPGNHHGAGHANGHAGYCQSRSQDFRILTTVLLWHATFAANSVAHLFGRRRYETSDTSRNSLLVALMTNGEGWHNNHHCYPTSARQGFFWWEIDLSYYLLYGLSTVGLVHDVRTPPRRILTGHAPEVARRTLPSPRGGQIARIRASLRGPTMPAPPMDADRPSSRHPVRHQTGGIGARQRI
jgi:hypothetical protein